MILVDLLEDLLRAFEAALTGALNRPGPAATGRYGPHPLGRDDRDAAGTAGAVYGGKSGLPPDQLPTAAPGWVKRLNDDLRACGLTLAPAGSGEFTVGTERALRELLVYAQMPNLARRDDQAVLVPVPNPKPYTGPVTGWLTPHAAAILTAWVDAGLRVPVIVRSRAEAAADIDPEERYGPHDGAPPPAPANASESETERVREQARAMRFEAIDVSGHYRPARIEHPVGAYAPPSAGSPGGPYSSAFSKTATARVTQQTLAGNDPSVATPAGQSAFRVVSAVAHAETSGFFDAANLWDRAYASFGIYQWTINPERRTNHGELGAFLAFLHHHDWQLYDKYFAKLGLAVPHAPGGPGGASLWRAGDEQGTGLLWNPLQRKWWGRVMLFGHSKNGARELGWHEVVDADEFEHFRTWHWQHRLLMAARDDTEIRRLEWKFARARLRVLLDTPLTHVPNPVGAAPAVLVADRQGNPARLRDIVATETAVGALLRVHVLYPPAVVEGGGAGPDVRHVLVPKKQLADWGPADKEAFSQGVVEHLSRVKRHANGTPVLRKGKTVPQWDGVDRALKRLGAGTFISE